MNKNYILIIGAMKAGTTTLFDHLAAHPAICPANPKEPGFFAFEEEFSKGRAAYDALFDFDHQAHQYVLDGSTDYTKFPHATGIPERMSAFGGNYKLIYLMRHPIKRMQSHAKHTQFKRKELGQIASPIEDHSLDNGISPLSMDVSRYAMQLGMYKEFYDRGDLLLLSLEELTADGQGTLARIYDFLKLDGNDFPKELTASNKAAVTQREIEPHPAWKLAQSIKLLTAVVKALIPEDVRTRMRHKTRRSVEVLGRFKMTPEEEARYLDILAPDLIRLRDVYGFDIKKHWQIDL